MWASCWSLKRCKLIVAFRRPLSFVQLPPSFEVRGISNQDHRQGGRPWCCTSCSVDRLQLLYCCPKRRPLKLIIISKSNKQTTCFFFLQQTKSAEIKMKWKIMLKNNINNWCISFEIVEELKSSFLMEADTRFFGWWWMQQIEKLRMMKMNQLGKKNEKLFSSKKYANFF